MAINFDTALGIHPHALALREKRGEILAANMANADTPDYKARDLDFKSILNQAVASTDNPQRTHVKHMGGLDELMGGHLLYRNPLHPSLDGNTVESQIEQAKYAENAVQYQASLQFVNDDLAGLRAAIRGE